MPDDFKAPDFLVAFYKLKVVTHLSEQIDDFMKHFVTTEEEKWINFIKEEKIKLSRIDR